MKLHFKNQVVMIDDQVTVEEIIQEINNLLGKEYYFEGLDIDGKLVNEAPERYITEHLSEIEDVEILALEAEPFILSLLASAEEYVVRVNERTQQLAELFKKEIIVQEAWNDLDGLLGGLQWLMSMGDVVNDSLIEVNEWDQAILAREQFEAQLSILVHAMEEQDTLAIAHMIEHNISVYCKTIQQIIENAFEKQYQRPTVQ